MRPTESPSGPADVGRDAASPNVLATIAKAVERLRYGAIHLTIHDGRVVQLEVTERERFHLT